MPFGIEKLHVKWLGYPTVKKVVDTFIRFDRIHERDRQTDGQTDGRTQTPHDLMTAPLIRHYRHSAL